MTTDASQLKTQAPEHCDDLSTGPAHNAHSRPHGQGRRRRPGLRRAPARDARGRGRVPGRRLRHLAPTRRRAAQRAARTWRTSPHDAARAPRSPPAICPTLRPRRPRAASTSRSITVQTPLREGMPDLSFIEAAARDLAAHLTPGALVVARVDHVSRHDRRALCPILEESGCSAGDRLLPRLLARADRPGQHRVDVREHRRRSCRASTPTRWRSSRRSTARSSTRSCRSARPPRPSSSSCSRTRSGTSTSRSSTSSRCSPATSASTSGRRSTRAATKPYGFMRFTPGPGVGGHCLPIDPSYLAWRVERQLGHRFRFVELANDVNRGMPDYVVGRVMAMLNDDGSAGQRLAHPAARARLQARRPATGGSRRRW